MAIFKATYTRSAAGAKASLRYIGNRPGKDNAKMVRTLWGIDGPMEREEAYTMIDGAAKGSYFFRFVISPDPVKEDTNRDLFLRDLTEQTMLKLEERVQRDIQWVAATHSDHAPHRHIHVVAILPKKLHVYELQAARQIATELALSQRQEQDRMLQLQQQQERGREAEWELQQ